MTTLWNDLEPVLRNDAFARACERAADVASSFVDSAPHRPRLTPDDLRAVGVESETVSALRDLFAEFNRGAVETVLPAVPVYAETLDAAGPRDPFGVGQS